MNQLHEMMTLARSQAETPSGEEFVYAGKTYTGFIAPATYQDQSMVDGYLQMADFILVVDKAKFEKGTVPDMKRGQITARGREMRIVSGLEDASSYTLTLKINP